MTLTRSERDERDSARNTLRKLSRKARQQAKERRPANPKKDRGRVRNNAYLAWLRRQPCAVHNQWCFGRIEAAHVRTHKPGELPTGLQRKPDDERATPLCAHHHAQQHRANESVWWRAQGLDPFEVAATHFARFQSETQTLKGGAK